MGRAQTQGGADITINSELAIEGTSKATPGTTSLINQKDNTKVEAGTLRWGWEIAGGPLRPATQAFP